MSDQALFDAIRKIFPPNAPYQLPEGVLPLSEDPKKAEILAEMPECNALGIVGRDDVGPQNRKVRARKVKVPCSSGEEEEASESETESVESSEVEFTGSAEDSDGDNDGDDDDGDDNDDDESGGRSRPRRRRGSGGKGLLPAPIRWTHRGPQSGD